MIEVKVIEIRFMEDSVWEGSYAAHYEGETTYEWDTATEAADFITRQGLTFSATGGSWAANPDGSVIIDYATGEREEVSAHVTASVEDMDMIMDMVG